MNQPSVNRPAPGSPGFAARLGATVLFLIPLLVMAEWVVAWVQRAEEARRDTISAPYLPARLAPYYEGMVWGLPFRTNRYGFRGEADFPLSPEEDEFRILLLGDSVGVGLGVTASESFAKVAEQRLNQAAGRPEVHIINASGQGYSPSGYLAYLKHEGLEFDPRVVLLAVEVTNDVTDEALLHWEDSDPAPGPEGVRGGRYVVSWDGNLLATVAQGPYWFEKTYLYTLLLRRTFSTGWRWFGDGPMAEEGVTYYHLGFDRAALGRARIEGGWRRLFSTLEAADELLRTRGVQFRVLFFPSRYLFEPNNRATTRFAAAIQTRALSLAQERGLPYWEFAEALEKAGGSALFSDFAHLTVPGNRVVGEELASRLHPLTSG